MVRIISIFTALALFTTTLAAPAQQVLDNSSGSRLWRLCGDPSTHLLKAYSNGVSITPSQPKVGSDLDVVIKGILDSDVTGGTVNVDLKLMSLIKVQKDLELCSMLNSDFMAGGTTCPMRSGEVTIQAHAHIPSEVPKVPVAGEIRILNQDGDVVTCVQIDLKLH